MGFGHVESGPLVRSSYHAWQHVPQDASRASGREIRKGGASPVFPAPA
jgi:hypothetical protein